MEGLRITHTCSRQLMMKTTRGQDNLPVGVSLVHQVATALSQLTDGFRVVVHGLLETAVFLQHVGGAHLVLGTVLTHHVQLLLTHPCLSLRSIEKVLQMVTITGDR